MKVFNLSLRRCGSQSLNLALTKLGFDTTATSRSNIRPWRMGRQDLFREELRYHDAFPSALGWYGADILREVVNTNPDAHFIILERNLDEWLDSWDRYKITTVAAQILTGSVHEPIPRTSQLIKIWERHKQVVDQLEPKHLLRISLDKLDWDTLAKFLDKPVPREEFPKLNVTGETLTYVVETAERLRRIHIVPPPPPRRPRRTKLFKHLLLTRYNFRLYGPDRMQPEIRDTQLPPEGWMWHRYWLFREFCLPSVLRQTNQDFDWLVILDPKTPARHLRHIEAVLPENAEIIMCPTHDDISEEVNKRTRGEYTISTMLDNDDMLRKDAIEQIQQLARRIIRRKNPEDHCIDVPNGYTANEQLSEFYELTLVNAKHSKRTSFVTYLTSSNTKTNALRFAALCKMQPTAVSFIEERLWTRIIHSENLCNQLSGTRCRTPDGFGVGVKVKLPTEFPDI